MNREERKDHQGGTRSSAPRMGGLRPASLPGCCGKTPAQIGHFRQLFTALSHSTRAMMLQREALAHARCRGARSAGKEVHNGAFAVFVVLAVQF